MTSIARLSREERKAETRARLLEAAAEVFARRGFQAASVDEVAEAAGFTKGAVYAHFESKEELFLAMLDERFTQRIAELRAIGSGSPTEEAREAGAQFTRYLEQDPEWCLLFFEFWAHAVRNPDVARQLLVRYRRLRDGIAGVVEERAAEVGIELPFPPDQIALMCFAMGNGVALERVLEPEAVSADLFGTMLSAFFLGLKAMAEQQAPVR